MECIIKEAQTSDAKDLYEWEFHPSTRKWMKSKSHVTFEHHCVWLEKVINSLDIKLFICSIEGYGNVGVVRVDKTDKNGEVMIGITISPIHRGKGFSSTCLNKVMEFVAMELWETKKYVAEILKENVVSIRAFEKVGFQLLCETKQSKFLTKVWSLNRS